MFIGAHRLVRKKAWEASKLTREIKLTNVNEVVIGESGGNSSNGV